MGLYCKSLESLIFRDNSYRVLQIVYPRIYFMNVGYDLLRKDPKLTKNDFLEILYQIIYSLVRLEIFGLI